MFLLHRMYTSTIFPIISGLLASPTHPVLFWALNKRANHEEHCPDLDRSSFKIGCLLQFSNFALAKGGSLFGLAKVFIYFKAIQWQLTFRPYSQLEGQSL